MALTTARCRLDGDGLEAVSVTRRRQAGRVAHGRAGAGRRHRRQVGDGRDRGRHFPRRQQQADGPLCLGRDIVHPVRGRRLPPDHLLPRPARRPVALSRAHGSGRAQASRSCCPTATASATAQARTAALGRMGGPLPQALLFVRAGRRRPCRQPRQLHDHERAQGRSRHLGARSRPAAHRPRHGQPQAGDALGRGGLWPRI